MSNNLPIRYGVDSASFDCPSWCTVGIEEHQAEVANGDVIHGCTWQGEGGWSVTADLVLSRLTGERLEEDIDARIGRALSPEAARMFAAAVENAADVLIGSRPATGSSAACPPWCTTTSHRDPSSLYDPADEAHATHLVDTSLPASVDLNQDYDTGALSLSWWAWERKTTDADPEVLRRVAAELSAAADRLEAILAGGDRR